MKIGVFTFTLTGWSFTGLILSKFVPIKVFAKANSYQQSFNN